MATYKLIQDIEAEDHILGPLTLRQFIFALIAAFCFYICFILLEKHVDFLLVLFLPPALFFGFFAIPFGRDQPTEIWVLAKIRFFLKPRKRIWDQSGLKELVTITVPKKIEKHLTNGLNQYEVESRLTALANTLDSRGWAIKNANVSAAAMTFSPSYGDADSDRLIDVSNQPQAPEDQVPVEADMLDEANSPVAQHFNQMINQNSASHRQELIKEMNSDTPIPVPQQSNFAQPMTPAPAMPTNSSGGNNQWFMPHLNDTNSTVTAPQVSAQNVTADEELLAEKIKANRNAQQTYSNNLRTLQPLGSQPTMPANPVPPSDQSQTNASDQTLTDQPDPAIMSLANNNDFTVDTIAREAKRAKQSNLDDQDEVVIPLH